MFASMKRCKVSVTSVIVPYRRGTICARRVAKFSFRRAPRLDRSGKAGALSDRERWPWKRAADRACTASRKSGEAGNLSCSGRRFHGEGELGLVVGILVYLAVI